jgi:peptide methionine sulfoxide reductase msrA/msrB
VNSISLEFSAAAQAPAVEERMMEKNVEDAYFAGGCFWGVEYWFDREPGVLKAESGYMGGELDNPSYDQVKTGATGHAETVHVVFDPAVTTYEKLARLFMEIHDPTEINRQGPDIGHQYRSAVFTVDDAQRTVIDRLVAELKAKGFRVQTEVRPAGRFWTAEEYHQDWYERKGSEPYCHSRVKRF